MGAVGRTVDEADLTWVAGRGGCGLRVDVPDVEDELLLSSNVGVNRGSVGRDRASEVFISRYFLIVGVRGAVKLWSRLSIRCTENHQSKELTSRRDLEIEAYKHRIISCQWL